MAAQAMDHKEWLAKLVAFDTTSRNSNLDLIHYCKEYLEGLGVKCTLVHNAEKTKANLWATLPGDGGVTDGGIILSGHTDVVPVDGQKWDSDPFTLTEKDGRLYGRGTSDMKGFVAVAMSLTPEFLRMRRAKPIHFAWSYDEEVGCLGGKVLAEFLRDNNIKADGCIVGEPTGMLVRTGNKVIARWQISVFGKEMNSLFSLPEGDVDITDYVSKVILKVSDLVNNGAYFDVDNEDSASLRMSSNGVGKEKTDPSILPADCKFFFECYPPSSKYVPWLLFLVQEYVDKELLPSLRMEFPDACMEVDVLCSSAVINSREQLEQPQGGPFFLSSFHSKESFNNHNSMEFVRLDDTFELRNFLLREVALVSRGCDSHL
ncbi:glutamamyl carboxypeptidase [Trypanosoma theileri]|uniref:Glutamamyl carboxypeptidase n=1 Tax=Trypanosoma theileri TaxID=67003 RepID=A0A1X0NPX5_9TRYP|nr:glutamamyl carboxypeptidase [Trypanosoma theileri]ORC86766.1 glutamamyl carboxypeptidase [Trypanosoma theileri]